MAELNYITKETLVQMKEELAKLKTSGRADIARQIAEAREKGDLKENAEYDAAKEAQGYHEAKIAVLESAIVSARVIDAKNIDTTKVSILSKVTLTNMQTNKQIVYQITSETEADLKLGKISASSPIGKGLLGRAQGDVAEITVPNGIIRLRVESITA
jgi:transcription elongation factor GreA